MIETATPNSKEEWLQLRKSVIGASEIAALFGCNPWMTPYKLFMKKTGQYEEKRESVKITESSIHLPPLERGNFMESKGLEILGMLRPDWHVSPNTIPGGAMYIDRESGISATPDAFVIAPDRPGQGTTQIKTVAPMTFDREWKGELMGSVAFPTHVGIQTIVDASLSGCEWACAGALVNGFGVDFHLVDVPLTAGLMDKARALAKDFWRRVRENDPYPPDYGKDGDVINAVYSEDDGGEVDLSSNDWILDVLSTRAELVAREKDSGVASKERKAIDRRIIKEALGNAVRGTLPDGRILEAKTVRKMEFLSPASTYRSIKIRKSA